MSGRANTLSDQVGVKELEPGHYISICNPDRTGNTANIAYGGCALGVAISAACKTVDPKYHLYTAMGNYLGPAMTDRKLLATVSKIRDTRTFVTRQVQVSQEQSDGSVRPCLVALLDFQVSEKSSLLAYSAPPTRSYTPVESLKTTAEINAEAVASGKASQQLINLRSMLFGMMDRLLETRQTPEGMLTQNLGGFIKVPTTQDATPFTDRTSGDYFKVKHSLDSQDDQVAGLGFVMDGALSFIPLTHSNMAMTEAGACSSLDFALRVFVNDPDLNEWNFREIRTVTGGDGRTYSESRLWDKNGRMISNMTQQCIMRPLAPKKPKPSL